MADQESFEVDLDLLDESSIEETIEIDPDIDPLEEPNPVEDGIHRVKVLQAPSAAWSKKSWTDKKTGAEHDFLTVKFSLQVLDEGVDLNKRIFPQALNTIVFDKKSPMAHLLIQILGGTQEAKDHVKGLATNYVALGKAFKEALAGEPVVKVQTRWVARLKTGEKKKGFDTYRTVLSGMKSFKKRPGGTYDPVVVSRGDEARARAEVVAYFPDDVSGS